MAKRKGEDYTLFWKVRGPARAAQPARGTNAGRQLLLPIDSRASRRALCVPGATASPIPTGPQDTPDFLRLAAKCNAIIIPFSSVGGDDAFDVGRPNAAACSSLLTLLLLIASPAALQA